MEKLRKPLQGTWNIVRFNWHFYAASAGSVVALLLTSMYTGSTLSLYLRLAGLGILLPTIVSLIVSYYVYDVSNLYQFNWINDAIPNGNATIVNIHAGFDETSMLIRNQFSAAHLHVFDFYDPKQHTELSIKRARKAYPMFPGTQRVTTGSLPLAAASADTVLLIFAAHEIRNQGERIAFLAAVKRVLKPGGKIVIVEHLRDLPNFLAYTIGFLHFYSRRSWLQVFQSAKLSVQKEQKITPFISSFTLTKNGVAP